MKKLLRLTLAASLVFSLLAVAPVVAQNDNSATTTTTEDKATALKARLEKRKTEQATKLTTAQETRLKSHCVVAQGFLKTVDERTAKLKTSREKIHTSMVEKLTELSRKLKAKELDTSDLNVQIATLKTAITAFDTTLASYTTAIADLTVIDCETDPTAFKASLEAARSEREDLALKAKAIREQWTTIKTTITTMKAVIDTTDITTEETN